MADAAMTTRRFAKRRSRGGWSLLELMIVVAVLAILLGIAIPSYRIYLQRAHRAEAINTLLQIAGCQERVRSETGFYDTTRCLRQTTGAGYRIRLQPVRQRDSLRFEVIASPVRASDDCGELSIDQSGTRRIGGDARRFADCWSGR
jgi:type IV pilus assembly protein PilE